MLAMAGLHTLWSRLAEAISSQRRLKYYLPPVLRPSFADRAMVGVMFTRLRRQGGLGLPADVTSQVELFAMGPTPSAMAVQKELSALPSGLISAAERQLARGDLS